MFGNKQIKEAKLLDKAARKFLHYKDDILSEEKKQAIHTEQKTLRKAIKEKDSSTCQSSSDTLAKLCEASVAPQTQSALRENVEVFFVAIVIALGIRSYMVQPFRIPTGSMQPTLNGVIATEVSNWGSPTTNHLGAEESIELPKQPQRAFERFLLGRRYIEISADRGGMLRAKDPITEETKFRFFTSTVLHLENGGKIKIPAPKQVAIHQLKLHDKLQKEERGRLRVKKGDLLARGRIITGDQVLVNKATYHFRKPKRGEIFVFRTNDIRGIRLDDPRQGSIHYIKRLVGLPEDQLEVVQPNLLINGKPAQEEGIQRVMSLKNGYRGYAESRHGLRMNQIQLDSERYYGNQRQYFAMGDNSYHSSDGRMWGPVPERNLVGPHLCVYFPFGKHWGRVK